MSILRLSLTVLFYPSDSFRIAKRESKRPLMLPSLVVMASLLATRVIYIRFLHYPVSPYDLNRMNIVLDLVMYAVVALSWSLGVYMMSAILNGSSFFNETLYATMLALMPLVALQAPIVLLSRVMGDSEWSILRVLQAAMWGWVAFLLFRSIQVMNDYTFWQTVVVIIVSVLFVALLWCLIIMMVVFGMNFWQFIYGFFIELSVGV